LNLNKFSQVWSNEPNASHVKLFVRNLFKKVGDNLGWEAKSGESASQTLLRTTVLNQLGSNDDQSVIDEAKKRFSNRASVPIPADIRFLVYKLVVAHGTSADYEDMYQIFKTAEMAEEKLRALRALGYSDDSSLLSRTLQLSLTEEVRSQDLMYVFASCGSSLKGREMTWQFFKDNFSAFEHRLSASMMLMDRLVSYSIDGFASDEKAQDVEKFFGSHPVPNADRSIKQGLESIRAHAKWVNTNRDSVAKYLAEQH